MGGTSSQPLASDTSAASAEAEAGGAEEGFFTLSESFQEQMALQFQNEQVVKLFGKQIEKIGERKAIAYKEAMVQKANLQQKMVEFRKQNEKTQEKLNATIEGYEDKFTDVSNIVEYDISRLEKTYLFNSSSSSPSNNSLKIPCFVEQTDIATCLQKNKLKDDLFICDVFITALKDCTYQTITAKVEQ
mmetsp:Transcript_11208/g.12921  ORF Transcript_11208/g.12921 Transcript_11208/m.12921 type:complete len:188 (+) Transcript_11208:53-616(+)